MDAPGRHATCAAPARFVAGRRFVAMTLVASLALLLKSCTVGLPVPQVTADAEAPVVLVVTRVVVDTAQRAEFDRQTRRVMASMDQHPGLLGYAARRELFGNQGWTMSVWTDDASRAAFVRSAVHREAIARSLPALITVELKRLTVPRTELPADWDAVLRLLADPDGRRNYWD